MEHVREIIWKHRNVMLGVAQRTVFAIRGLTGVFVMFPVRWEHKPEQEMS
jgi:hypothetical protein